jgi:type II secretory pathway pseudopilin PulG
MYTYFSRFLHHTLSYSGLTRISRWNKFANWFDLDTPIKSECDSLCTGRSMVEMLGVLAIIGVLSVGAIAGYSKAMMKYRLNKQAEQLNTVINAVARNVHSFDNLLSGNYYLKLTSTFVKMGEIPVAMQCREDYICDVFNQFWLISIINSDTGTTLNLSVNATNTLKNKSTDNLEICRNIIITAKENSNNISSVSNVTYNQDSDKYSATFLYGDNYCLSGRPCLKNLNLDDIYNFCTKFTGGDKMPHLKITWVIK